jgi:hypothetical protein
MPDDTTLDAGQIEKARRTIWPLRNLRRPLGQLLDEGIVTNQDLGFAVDRAYQQEVREAARILLLDRMLGLPKTPAAQRQPLNVVAPDYRTFVERRQVQLIMLQGAIMGATMGVLVMILLFSLQSPRSGESANVDFTPLVFIGVIIILMMYIALLAAFFKLMDWILDRLDKQVRQFRKGQQAEEQVLYIMHYALDSGWWLFRNMELPGRRIGDIDFALVGPAGLWVFEVKAYEGTFRNVGDQWERQVGARWQRARTKPSLQAKRNAASLSGLLKMRDIQQWVEPVVIWANPNSNLRTENPAVAVWQISELSNELNKLKAAKPRLDQQKIEQIAELLKSVYREPFSVDEGTTVNGG